MNDRYYYAWRDCPTIKTIYGLGHLSPYKRHTIEWRLKAFESWQHSHIEPKVGIEPIVKGLLWRATHWDIKELKEDALKVAKHLDFYDLASDELIDMIRGARA